MGQARVRASDLRAPTDHWTRAGTTMKEIRIDVNMILAGDVGGTNTRLGLFDPRTQRPTPVVLESFNTTEYENLTSMVAAFAADDRLRNVKLTAACFGVAGPVLAETARLTNVPFTIDGPGIARALDLPRVGLVNDLEALAHAVPWLRANELHVLQAGETDSRGSIGLIAAGTGLGEAVLHRSTILHCADLRCDLGQAGPARRLRGR